MWMVELQSENIPHIRPYNQPFPMVHALEIHGNSNQKIKYDI